MEQNLLDLWKLWKEALSLTFAVGLDRHVPCKQLLHL